MDTGVLAVAEDDNLLKYLINAAIENVKIHKGWNFA